jgi:SAM-dependent methyltransferase
MSSDEALYDRSFFDGIGDGSARSASVVVPMLLEATSATSLVDFGCGDGSWLAEWRQRGVCDVLGIDGPHVDPTRLKIPAENLLALDLRAPQPAPRRFDLATCLEVAEHLPASSADDLVDALVASADAVAFGAAVPGQEGTGHINLQWQSYWAGLFARRGFAPVDVIRKRCWDDASVEWWYSQNTLLYRRGDVEAFTPLDVAHPRLVELLCRRTSRNVGLREAFAVLPTAAGNTVRSRLRRRRATRGSAGTQ